jgi:hypothetical protein
MEFMPHQRPKRSSSPEDSEVEVDTNLVLSKKIKLRTVRGSIISASLQVFESDEPYVLIFLFVTEKNEEIRFDVFKDDLSRELRIWLEGKKYISNPAVLIPSRIEETIMKFIKFAKTPKQEDLLMWILSRCEFYSSYRNDNGKIIKSEIIFGGKTVSEEDEEEKLERLSHYKRSIIHNNYPKTSIIAAGKASQDPSHYILPSEDDIDGRRGRTKERQDEEDAYNALYDLDGSGTGRRRSHSTGGRNLTSKSLDLLSHDKDIFRNNDDMGMFALTKQLLGKSQTIATMKKHSVKGRSGATQALATSTFTNDHWRLFNEITKTRQEITQNMNERRKLLEIAKTRQLQKTAKFKAVRDTINADKGNNQFIKTATNELSVLQQVQNNISEDLKQQKIKISKGTQRVLWTMAPPGFANLRGKSQKGAVIGPGPLPANATTDLKDPVYEATVKRYYWDSAGRRHSRSSGIDANDGSDESLMEQAMNAIRKLSQNISAYKLDLKVVFEKFDTSGDGFLTAQEMAEAFLAMGVKLDIPTMQAIFK